MQMISKNKLGILFQDFIEEKRILHRDYLIKYINKMNAKSKARGAIGTLTNDWKHWAGYGVYTVEQLLNYLEKEYQHNLKKDERRNQ